MHVGPLPAALWQQRLFVFGSNCGLVNVQIITSLQQCNGIVTLEWQNASQIESLRKYSVCTWDAIFDAFLRNCEHRQDVNRQN